MHHKFIIHNALQIYNLKNKLHFTEANVGLTLMLLALAGMSNLPRRYTVTFSSASMLCHFTKYKTSL